MGVRKLAIIHYRKTGPLSRIVLRLARLPNLVPNKGRLLNRTFKKDLHLNLRKDPLRNRASKRELLPNRTFKKDRLPNLVLSSGPPLKLVRKPGPLLSQHRKKRKNLSRRGKNRLANSAWTERGKSLATPTYNFVLAVGSGGHGRSSGGVVLDDSTVFAGRSGRR
jgi:hypothetical protein